MLFVTLPTPRHVGARVDADDAVRNARQGARLFLRNVFGAGVRVVRGAELGCASLPRGGRDGAGAPPENVTT